MSVVAPGAGQYARWATFPASQGRISHFGGPADSGVKPNERMSLYPSERCRQPTDPWYVALRWGYAPHGHTVQGIPSGYFNWLRAQRIRVTNPRTGVSVRLRPADWGPHVDTGRLVDVSPQAMDHLGVKTDQTVTVAWDTPNSPLGPVTERPTGQASSTVGAAVATPVVVDDVPLDRFGPILDAQLSESMDEPSSLTVEVADPSGRLLRSELFQRTAQVELDDRAYRLRRVTRNATGALSLEFIDALAAQLIAYTFSEGLSQSAHAGTRTDWCQRIINLVVPGTPVRIQPGELTLQTMEVKAGDTAWAALGQAAEDVRWSRYTVDGTLVIGSDDWLMGQQEPVVFREHHDGVQSIAFDLVPGVLVSEATVTLDSGRWALRPGQPVMIKDCGPADGLWLITSVTRPLHQVRTQVRLRRAEPALPEPTGQATDSGAGGLVLDPLHPNRSMVHGTATRCMPDVVAPSRQWAGRQYQWGPYDCSATVSKGCIDTGLLQGRKTAHGLWQWASQAGLACSVADAKRTYGAMLFREGVHRETKRRSMVHVAWSLGDGCTFEARRSGTRIGEQPERHDWTHAARVPGATYQ